VAAAVDTNGLWLTGNGKMLCSIIKNEGKLLIKIYCHPPTNQRKREIFIRIKQATKRDMPIKPGAYCLATYQ